MSEHIEYEALGRYAEPIDALEDKPSRTLCGSDDGCFQWHTYPFPSNSLEAKHLFETQDSRTCYDYWEYENMV